MGGLQIPRWLGSDPLSAWWLGLAPATLEFWVRFPNERNQGKQAHPVLKYRVPHGSQVHTGLGSSSLVALMMSSTLLPPPREQLCNRSCSNKTHTQSKKKTPNRILESGRGRVRVLTVVRSCFEEDDDDPDKVEDEEAPQEEDDDDSAKVEDEEASATEEGNKPGAGRTTQRSVY